MAAAHLAPIDLALSMNGVKLYIHSNISKYVQLVIFLIIITANIIQIILTQYGIPFNLKAVGDMLPQIFSVVIKIYIYRKRDVILRLLSTVNQFLNKQQIQELRKFSFKCLIGYFIPSVSYLILCVIWTLSFDNIQYIMSASVVDESDWSKSVLAVVVLIGDTLFTHTTIFLTGSLYLVVLRSLKEISKSYYHSCLLSEKKDQIKRHIRNCQRLIGINDQFGQIFDLFPFLWCMLLYVQTSGCIVRTIEWSSGSTRSESTISLVFYLMTCATDTVY